MLEGFITDITVQKRAEEALIESEKQVRRKLDAVLSPEMDISQLELSNIIDSEKIQDLMNKFYELTKIGIGIIDLKGKVLVGTGWQDICTRFHRVNPETSRLCVESDIELSSGVPPGTFRQYRCKNNMWDIATPIMLGNRHMGNIFLGQFLFEDEKPDYNTFRMQARRYGFNEEEYLAALDLVPRWNKDTVAAAMSFYSGLAVMIGNLSYSNIKLANSLETLKRAEKSLHQLNSELRAITNCNQALIRAENEETLLDEICHIICDGTESLMVWVGYAEHDKTKTVCPVAWAGIDKDFFENAAITWAETDRGQTLAGKAIRSGNYVYVRDFMSESEAFPCCEHALKKGYRSGIAFPLKDKGDVTFGALNIYSENPDSFPADEIRILGELADDLAYGITALRIREEHKQARMELQKSNDLLQAIIESTPTALIGLDLEGRVQRVWNPAAEKMLGWSEQEALGRYLPSVPTDKEDEFNHFREMIKNGKPLYGIDVQRQKKDGTPIEYSIYASPLHDMDGQIVGKIAVLVDITERKRMENELRETERYRSIINRIQSIFLTVQDDQMYNHVLSVVREVLESRFGVFGYIADNGDLVIPSLTSEVWDRCEVTGKSNVFPASTWGDSLWGKSIIEKKSFYSTGPFSIPTGHIRIENFLTAPIIFRDNVIGLISVANRETGYTDADRDLLENICMNISPILNARIQRDRNEEMRRRSEDMLAKSERHFKQTLEACRIGIWDWDVVHDTYLVSPVYYTMLGYEPKTTMANRIKLLEWAHPDDRYLINEQVSRVLSQDWGEYSYEARFRHADGSYRWCYSLGFATETDQDGKVTRMMGIRMDINKRKKLENIMQARLRLLEFAASHPVDEILIAVLDEIEALTESSIGFYHFLEPDQKTLSLRSWSTNTLQTMCKAEGKGSHYDISRAGVWVDCIHERRPVIHNDYAALPHRKGMPPGHAPVIREAVVPIFRAGMIKAIIGVGNKTNLYNDEDISIISTLGDLSWDIVDVKLSEKRLRESCTLFREKHEPVPIGEEALDPFFISMKKTWEKTFNALPDPIVILNANYEIVRSNSAMAVLVGMAPSDIIGKKCFEIVHCLPYPPENCPHTCTLLDGKVHSFEIFEKHFDSWLNFTTVPFSDKNGNTLFSVHIIKDVTQQKRDREQLTAALSDKEMLFRELQHRVKNSLNLISSLINLEKDRRTDRDSITLLDNLQGRILSLASLYEALSQTGDVSKVDLDVYIKGVLKSIGTSIVYDSNVIVIQERLQHVSVDVKKAMAWGLIVNEFVTNALKHAFPDSRPGEVLVELQETEGIIDLSVVDNGQGPDPSFTIEGSDGFGMTIVRALARQMGGSVAFNRDVKTTFMASAPADYDEK